MARKQQEDQQLIVLKMPLKIPIRIEKSLSIKVNLDLNDHGLDFSLSHCPWSLTALTTSKHNIHTTIVFLTNFYTLFTLDYGPTTKNKKNILHLASFLKCLRPCKHHSPPTS